MNGELDGHGRAKEHPSGWTILQSSSSPAFDSDSRFMSESSEDLRDELMSTDDAQNGVRNSPSPIYFSPPKVVHKRKMQYMTASPSGKKKKRSQVEDASMNVSRPLQVLERPLDTPRPDPILVAIPPVHGPEEHLFVYGTLGQHAAPPGPSESTTQTPTTSTVSASEIPPRQVARKSTGGRSTTKESRLEARARVSEAVRDLLATKSKTYRGDKHNNNDVEHDCIVITDSDDDTSPAPPSQSTSAISPKPRRVSPRTPGASGKTVEGRKVMQSDPVMSGHQDSQIDQISMRQEEEESDDELAEPSTLAGHARQLLQELKSTVVAGTNLPSLNGSRMEYIVISSDSELEDEPGSKPSGPMQKYHTESPQKSHVTPAPSSPRRTSPSAPRQEPIGNKDEPIVISDSEDEAEAQSSRTLSESGPGKCTPVDFVERVLPDDDLHALDGVYSDSLCSSPELADHARYDDSEPSAAPSVPVPVSKRSTEEVGPSHLVPELSSSMTSTPSDKLKRRVTMVGSLYGGQRGFFKRAHSGSESTSASECQAQDQAITATDTAFVHLHEAVSQLNSLQSTSRPLPSAPLAPPQSLSDIIHSAALRNARATTSAAPTPTRSPITELEDKEVEMMLEPSDEDKSRTLSKVDRWRKPSKRPSSSSSESQSSQLPSRANSARSSPAPSSSSSGRPSRLARLKRSALTKQPGITRFGLSIVRSKVDILMHKRKHPAKEFAALSVSAHTLPHTFTYYLTQLSRTQSLKSKDIQEIFSDVIQVNTQEDEPDAPRIAIVNDINPEEEPTPPHNYHYGNLMIHHECVPQPQCKASMLPHCRCTGGCKPNSCPCAMRQMQHLPSDTKWSGFAYARDKTLRPQMLGYPIMECNMYCGCNDECQNRVVQNGRTSAVKVKIQRTVQKGWGVFADGDEFIPENTFIGIYAGEYITIEEAEKREHIYNQSGRTYLFDIDFDFDSPDDGTNLSQTLPKEEEEEEGPLYCIDAFYTGNFTRYLNHSCDPNCVIMACFINESNIKKPLITIFSCRDILPGEELSLSYLGDMSSVKDAGSHSHGTQVTTCHCGSSKCIGRIWK